MIHAIPPGEESLHEESSECDCNPHFEVDKESGEMVWYHLPLTFEISTPGMQVRRILYLLYPLALNFH